MILQRVLRLLSTPQKVLRLLLVRQIVLRLPIQPHKAQLLVTLQHIIHLIQPQAVGQVMCTEIHQLTIFGFTTQTTLNLKQLRGRVLLLLLLLNNRG